MVRTLRTRWIRLFAIFLPLVLLGVAGAAPGDLDTTFGPLPSNGIPGIVVVDGSNQSAFAVAVQADGKLVVGGRANGGLGVFRLTSSGALDLTFGGGDGVVVTPVGGGSPEIQGLAIQSDGKIVAAGRNTGSDGFTLVRYDSAGNLDASFDGDGIVDTVFAEGLADAWALALQPDGKIVVVGEVTGVGGGVALARYDGLNGGLDPLFGTGGKVVNSFGVGGGALAVAFQSDGKIVVSGSALSPSGGLDFFVARFDSSGAVDTTFNAPAGFVTTDFNDIFLSPGSRDVGSAVAIQPDGKIVVAGYFEEASGGGDTVLLARYSTDGSLDATFGTGGRVTGPSGFSSALVLQPDGKIVVGGSADGDFRLVRYSADGSLDQGFGVGGVVTHDIGGNGFDSITDVVLQPNGEIVAVGQGLSATSSDLASVVARYVNPPTIDNASVTPSLLWPPNHKMVPVVVTVEASDETEPPTCGITEITSNEPVNGSGDGNTAPDWLVTGPLTAQLRAERAGGGGGRIYTLTVECVDLADNAITTQVAVTVPHSKKN